MSLKRFVKLTGAVVVAVIWVTAALSCNKRTTMAPELTAAEPMSVSQNSNDTGNDSGDTFIDPRDGKRYRTVKIGKLTWMAENLNYATGSSLCYDDDESNCQKYGRLYVWDAAMSACPAGWHLPTREDWNNLVENAGGDVAGTKLKSKSSDWNGTDNFGFSALPGGYRLTDGFSGAGSNGGWWNATEYDAGNAWRRSMRSDDEYVDEYNKIIVHNYSKALGLSVRCVRE
ncbi:MAG: fibrobacter succinogenes major paralogous domain-containing protein [Bacteroidales bacterium]|jgi:uncharacterized protein (TIGR02145 family)|nr:fibrobacter succinogenes major paralogous domain-containing protein [Bacteroidales bacterium]